MIEPDDDALAIGKPVYDGFQYNWPSGAPYPLISLMSATIYEQLAFGKWGTNRLIDAIDWWMTRNPDRWRP